MEVETGSKKEILHESNVSHKFLFLIFKNHCWFSYQLLVISCIMACIW